MFGAKQTSSGVQGAACLQRKHCPNAAFPVALLLAKAIARHEDGSLGSQEGTASPNQGSSSTPTFSPQPLAALVPSERGQALSPSILPTPQREGSGREPLQRPCRRR